MNLTLKVGILVVSKLPTIWLEKGNFMLYHVIYMVKDIQYSIMPCEFESDEGSLNPYSL
jgi:hypothetical protein